MKDEFCYGVEDKNERPWRYLEWRRLAQGLSALDAIIQPSLDNKALLRSWAQRKPKPPETLGLHKESQAFGDIWWPGVVNPQKKSRSLASI